MITLKNKQRRMRTFNLDAPFFVKRHGDTLYGRAEVLTLLSLERREGLPDAITGCTEIKAAVDSGNLRVYPSPEPASEPKAKEKPLAVEPKAEATKPKPVAEPKPAARKTTFRRSSKED